MYKRQVRKRGNVAGLLAASGSAPTVETDENGHIVQLTLPGGGELNYRYSGNNLVSFTDQNLSLIHI